MTPQEISIKHNHWLQRATYPISHLPFLIPGPRLDLPKPPQGQDQARQKTPSYSPDDHITILTTLLGEQPNKHISRYLQQAGQHTGNQDDEKKRHSRILDTLLKNTLKAHTRLFALHCAVKYGTQHATPPEQLALQSEDST
jgi:hypothetical protein